VIVLSSAGDALFLPGDLERAAGITRSLKSWRCGTKDGPFSLGLEVKKIKKEYLFSKTNRRSSLNTAKDYMNSRKRTGKRSGEVIENTFLWKKRT
jgi:hypothetical protein